MRNLSLSSLLVPFFFHAFRLFLLLVTLSFDSRDILLHRAINFPPNRRLPWPAFPCWPQKFATFHARVWKQVNENEFWWETYLRNIGFMLIAAWLLHKLEPALADQPSSVQPLLCKRDWAARKQNRVFRWPSRSIKILDQLWLFILPNG
jgi:hypothetical protein